MASKLVKVTGSSTVPSKALGATAKTPLWLWPNMLSLDAPAIAAVWQDLFAFDAQVHLSLAARAALSSAVWLIYLGDRLLDTRMGTSPQLSARHAFYTAHRGICHFLTAVASGLLAVSALYLPRTVLKNGLAVSVVVAVYLVIIHSVRGKWRFWLPKEAAVGLVFAIGTVLAPVTRAANSGHLLFPALLLGVLCWVNCSAIEVWECGAVDRLSNWLVFHVRHVTASTALCCVALSYWGPTHHIALALFLASIGIGSVAVQKPKLDSDALRVWADVPLLAPLLLLGLR